MSLSPRQIAQNNPQMVLGLISRTGRGLGAVVRDCFGVPATDKAYFLDAGSSASRASLPGGRSVLAAGSIRNRGELCRELNLAAGSRDAVIGAAAFERWGRDCVHRLRGAWVLAVWDEAARSLFLARDPSGCTALYTYSDSALFAFATSRRDLIALARPQINELYLAQMLVSWPAYGGAECVHAGIERLPPGHTITVTPDKIERSRYWFPEHVSELRLKDRHAYAEGLRAVFDDAVREAMADDGPVAGTLSGGLDSGSVCITAAQFLRESGRRLTAYTSVPLSGTEAYVGTRFGDEWPFANATAQAAGNIDLLPIDGADVTPMGAIQTALQIIGEPMHAAGNLYWMLSLYRAAAAAGATTLLTGQMGNGGISWTGDALSQPLAYQLKKLGLKVWLKRRAKQLAPGSVVRSRRRFKGTDPWRRTAIRTEFAQRLDLFEGRINDPKEAPARSALTQRLAFMRPGAEIGGAIHAEMGAACGIRIADPTADPRVIEFCFAVPDWVFTDPKSGTDRWLIREAMKGRLPDEVRLNQRRGRQAGDLVPRLRACADEVEAALDACANGPAAAYVDAGRMRRVWQRLQTEDSNEAFALAITVLTRGLMAGLFVNGFGKEW